jgi:hypothetical protein
MLRGLSRIVGLVILIVAGSVGLYVYQDHFSATRRIEKLEQEKKVLEQVVQRLGEEKRVADVIVTEQTRIDGVPRTKLLFVEYARDGSPLPAKSFEIVGDELHVDAMRIRFDQHFVAEGDALRGHSIALFTRIYGNQQKPDEGARVDEPDKVPQVYRGADPRITEFETDLWKNFWRLADDPEYRKEKGVSVADGDGSWRPIAPGMIYTLTLQSNGGVSITSEPLKEVYKEMLRQKSAS